MKTRPLAVALLLTFTPAVLPPRAAFAQSADEATIKMARQRFQEGVAFYDKGQYELARASFLQAYALHKHPAVLLNLAQSSLKSGHTLEAAKYFQQYLREQTTASPQQRADADRGLREARQRLGHIDVAGAPNGTEIFVDEERAGMTPLDQPIDVEPGTHNVRARGKLEDTTQISVNAGQIVTARFGGGSAAAAPVPLPAPAPSAPAPASPAPEEPPAAAPTEAPPPEETQPTTATAETPTTHGTGLLDPPNNMVPVYVGGVAAVAGFATAITFFIFKQSAQNSADSVTATIKSNGGTTCNTSSPQYNPRFANICGTLKSDDDRVNQDALVGNIGLGVGIAATVFTVGYWALATKGGEAPASASAPMLTPMIGKGLGGLSWSASF